MVIFYFFNLLFAFLLIISPLWWSKKLLNLEFLNPVSIGIICILPIELFRLFIGQMVLGDGLIAPEYQFAVMMTNIQQSAGLGLLYLTAKIPSTRLLPTLLPKLGIYTPRDLRNFSFIFYIFYLAAFLTLALRSGGVSDWLIDIRGSYIEKREGNGIFYAAALSFLSISYFFAGVASKNSKIFSTLSLLYFISVYVLGSKGFILQFFIFFLIVIYRQRQYKIGKALTIMIPLAFILLIFNFFSQRDSIDLTALAEYFDYYPNAAMYYKDYFSGAINLFYGEVIASSFWAYLPRALFPEKPYVYGILHVVEIYYPGGAESGNTPAFYGGVPQFADFGIIGVLVFSLTNLSPVLYFVGLRYALKDKAFLNYGTMSGRTILICILLFSPSFGSFLPFGLLVSLLIAISIVIKSVRMITTGLSKSLAIWDRKSA